jgi:hypothetical protein
MFLTGYEVIRDPMSGFFLFVAKLTEKNDTAGLQILLEMSVRHPLVLRAPVFVSRSWAHRRVRSGRVSATCGYCRYAWSSGVPASLDPAEGEARTSHHVRRPCDRRGEQNFLADGGVVGFVEEGVATTTLRRCSDPIAESASDASAHWSSVVVAAAFIALFRCSAVLATLL